MKSVAIVGLGNVGTELMRQIVETHCQVKVVACCNSRYMKTNAEGFREVQKLNEGDQAFTLEALLSYLLTCPNPVLVDCTASLCFPSNYSQCLDSHISVVTANKAIFERPWSEVQSLVTSPSFAYEATCGAGLPIISTLKGLIATGDVVVSVTGLLSGTLAYVFSEMETGRKFSEVVLEAKALGYTEPDPRDDLSGRDVVRKLLVLARTLRLPLDMSQINCHSLVPPQWSQANLPDFLSIGLPSLDSEMEVLRQTADSTGSVLRFAATLDAGRQTGSVEVKAVSRSSALGQIHGTANVFHVVSQRYPSGLTISGAGAGATVTAMGVFTDILGVR